MTSALLALFLSHPNLEISVRFGKIISLLQIKLFLLFRTLAIFVFNFSHLYQVDGIEFVHELMNLMYQI